MTNDRPVRSHRRVMVVSGLALVVGLGLATEIAGADGLNTQTRQPLTDANRDCNGGLISPPTHTVGSAVMNQTPLAPVAEPASGEPGATGNLTVGVNVQGATPNATYNIRIIQDNDSAGVVGSCFVIVGTVTTDSNGNGSSGGATPVQAGATRWWVDLNNQQNFADFLDTDLVTIATQTVPGAQN